MARKNVVKVKKNHTWKFYTVISTIVGVLAVATVVVLAVLYNVFNTDTYRNRFEEYTKYKINYEDLDVKVKNDTNAEEIFVFVYDDTYLDQYEIDENIEKTNPLYEPATNALSGLKNLVDTIEKNNEDSTKKHVTFYVINASLIGNKEDGQILGNQSYGQIKAPGLIYIHGESCKETVELNDGTSFTLTASGTYEELAHVFIEAERYVSGQNWNNVKWN